MPHSILVTGAYGQLGKEIETLAPKYPDTRFKFTDVDSLDITDQRAVRELFRELNPDFCINCAAYTAVDRAESETELCRKVNATAASILAGICAEFQATFIHFSSDYVYHNHLNRPMVETDPTIPKSVYAQTKLEGEHMAHQQSPDTMVVRTSWVYSSFGKNFVKTMLRLGSERDHLRVVYDQVGAPTYARDIAAMVLHLVHTQERELLRGTFNFANEGVTSWYDFAHAIFEIKGLHCSLEAIPSTEYPTPAQRPNYSLLDKTKIKQHFGITIPHWRDSLKDCLQLL